MSSVTSRGTIPTAIANNPSASTPGSSDVAPSAQRSENLLERPQRTGGAIEARAETEKPPETGSIMARRAVRIVEVGPRDGLQNIKTSIPSETKLELISRLEATGLTSIELTSIVSPRAIPQLSDCRTILSNENVRALQDDTTKGLRLPVLVPNLKGLAIAIEHNVREVSVFLSAGDGFSKANINCTVDEALERAQQVASGAREAGMEVRGYISCIFEDPFDGPTPPEQVVRLVKQLIDAGCYEVSLGDTLGSGSASSVAHLFEALGSAGVPMSKLAGHFHDTYGQGVANIWQAYLCGVRVFDCSVAGLGGCPYCPGALGNVSTEDVVFMFEKAGISTGVDLARLVEVGCWISNTLGVRNASRAGAALATKHGILSKTIDAEAPADELASKCNPGKDVDDVNQRTNFAPFQAAMQILFQVLWGARHLLSVG